MRSWPLILLGLLCCIVHASPFLTNSEKRDLEYHELYDLAQRMYPGIWWQSARRTCSMDQFQNLYDATKNAVSMITSVIDSDDQPDLGLSAEWSMLFGDARIWQAQYPEELEAMLAIYNQTRHFLENGGRRENGEKKEKRQHRLAYVCGDDDGYSTCRKQEAPNAYVPTLPTRLENCSQCFVACFCDGFFKLDPILEIASGSHTDEKDFNSPKLGSREHAIFHEWMHVDLMGQSWHIEDLKKQDVYGTGVRNDIYGPQLSKDFAWKYMNEGKVNYEIRKNADNYAWVLSYSLYSAYFGWGVTA